MSRFDDLVKRLRNLHWPNGVVPEAADIIESLHASHAALLKAAKGYVAALDGDDNAPPDADSRLDEAIRAAEEIEK